jgi:XTP/dITP diphosphohydrolase
MNNIRNKLLIATANKGKISEFKHVFSDIQEKAIFLDDLPKVIEPEENGKTYKENALIKAHYYSKKFNMPVVTDDSGMEIDDLDGKPGIYSSRFLKQVNPNGGFDGLRDLLIAKAPHKKEFPAEFICCIVYKNGDFTKSFTSTKKGFLIFPPRGNSKTAFGYDPIFKFKDFEITMAEMSQSEKLAHSPRASAGKSLLQFLNQRELFSHN